MQTSTILPIVSPCSADWSLNQSLVSGATEMESCTLLFSLLGLPAPGLFPPLIDCCYGEDSPPLLDLCHYRNYLAGSDEVRAENCECHLYVLSLCELLEVTHEEVDRLVD